MVPLVVVLLAVLPAVLGQDLQCLSTAAVGPNSYLAYNISNLGPPCAASLRCEGNVTNQISLSGRSWFLTPTNKVTFYNHKNSWAQKWNVTCPYGNLLQLTVQSDDFSPNPAVVYQLTYDNTTIDISSPAVITDLLRNGLIVNSGTAVLEFLDTGSGTEDYGLVLRATCLPLANWYLPGCVTLQDVLALPGAQSFIDSTFNVSTSALQTRQDRSVHTFQETSFLQTILLHDSRAKRQTCDPNRMTLGSGDMVSLMMGTITVTDVNMTVLATYSQVNCITAYSPQTSTRTFFTNSPMLYGPGMLEVCGSVATYVYQISPQHFVPDATTAGIINKLYAALYVNNVQPYGVVDGINDDQSVFPYPDANSPYNSSYIPASRSRVILERVIGHPKADASGKICRRTMNSYIAPQFGDKLNQGFKTFCQLFQYACDVALRTACQEYLATDPLLA